MLRLNRTCIFEFAFFAFLMAVLGSIPQGYARDSIIINQSFYADDIKELNRLEKLAETNLIASKREALTFRYRLLTHLHIIETSSWRLKEQSGQLRELADNARKNAANNAKHANDWRRMADAPNTPADTRTKFHGYADQAMQRADTDMVLANEQDTKAEAIEREHGELIARKRAGDEIVGRLNAILARTTEPLRPKVASDLSVRLDPPAPQFSPTPNDANYTKSALLWQGEWRTNCGPKCLDDGTTARFFDLSRDASGDISGVYYMNHDKEKRRGILENSIISNNGRNLSINYSNSEPTNGTIEVHFSDETSNHFSGTWKDVSGNTGDILGFRIKQPAKVCGPDVTQQTYAVLRRISDDFYSSPSDDRSLACQNLLDPHYAILAWDIYPLHFQKNVPQNAIKNDPDQVPVEVKIDRVTALAPHCQIPNSDKTAHEFRCAKTFEFEGFCIHGSIINYAFWGLASRLCSDENFAALARWKRNTFDIGYSGNPYVPEAQEHFITLGQSFSDYIAGLSGSRWFSIERREATDYWDLARERFISEFKFLHDTNMQGREEGECALACTLTPNSQSEFDSLFDYHWDFIKGRYADGDNTVYEGGPIDRIPLALEREISEHNKRLLRLLTTGVPDLIEGRLTGSDN